jgi:hypothetical protein
VQAVKWIATVLAELVGLFVDDLGFTLAILAWVALGTLLLPRLGSADVWAAPLLFLGCAAILVESVRRAARRR